jgi:hypothetical protein
MSLDSHHILWAAFLVVFVSYLARIRRDPVYLFAAPAILTFLMSYVFIGRYFEVSVTERNLFLSPDYYAITLLYALVCLLGFCFFHEDGGNRIKQAKPEVELTEEVFRFRRNYALALSAVGIGGLLVFLRLSGGVMAFYSSAHGSGGAWTTTSAYIHSLPSFLWPAMLMFYSLWEHSGRKAKSALYPLLFLLVILTTHTYLMGNRNGVIRLALFLGGAYFFIRRPKGKEFTAMASVFALCFLIVMLLPHIRSSTHLGAETSVSEAFMEYMSKKKPSSRAGMKMATGDELFYNVAVVQGVSKQGEVGFGAQYVYVLINFIPRFVWADKPYRADFGLSGKKVAQQAVGWRVRNGAAINAVGHSFLEFWWFGCIAWAVLGYFCGRAFKSAQLNPSLHNIGLFLALDLSIVYWATQSFTAFFVGWFFVAAPFLGLRYLESNRFRIESPSRVRLQQPASRHLART